MSKPTFHGSDLEKISDYYQIPIDEIVNFGANVNPLGLSSSVLASLKENLHLLERYPDRSYTSLRKTIGGYCHVRPEQVVVGNGSTELISLLIHAKRARKALLIGPTYSEYERELRLAGGTMDFYDLREEADFQIDFDDFFKVLQNGYDLIILCNPNNPTSSALTTRQIQTILEHLEQIGGFLMIDETYVEFAPDVDQISAVSLVDRFDNFMVLRGVSKFFAAPGMRLGYGITGNRSFLETVQTLQNPWSLNSLGAYAGEQMLNDQTYIDATRSLILSEREKALCRLSDSKDLKAYPAYANFILVKLEKPGLTSQQMFERCIRQGMMIRDCSSFRQLPGEYIRFCIMRPEDNQRLLDLLCAISV